MLTNVHSITQKDFKNLVKFAARAGNNIMVLGPSGGGKTIITKDAAAEEDCQLIYINLAVLERTDFQGFPVISNDRSLVSYATPDFLPFADTASRDERKALNDFRDTLQDDDKDNDVIEFIDNRLKELDEKDKAKTLVRVSPYVHSAPESAIARIKELANIAKTKLQADKPIVFLFDEVDKAATETTQTLLELLQFGSINGRKLNAKASILTGNLPDEHAHTNQISHAISKRCATYKLELDFNQWREWAFKNGVHDHIIQFLSNEPKWLYQKAPDGDPTAYALPSPRTWTEAARIIEVFDTDSKMNRLSDDDKSDFRMHLLSGYVGDGAAGHFNTWYTYYRRFDPQISSLVNQGTHPNVSSMKAEEILIFAIAACSRVYTELKPNNKKRIKAVTENVYNWLKTCQSDIQIGAIRLSFGGDFDTCHQYNLQSIPEFVDVFGNVQKKLGKWS